MKKIIILLLLLFSYGYTYDLKDYNDQVKQETLAESKTINGNNFHFHSLATYQRLNNTLFSVSLASGALSTFFILVYSLAVLVDFENFRLTELSTMYGLLGTGLTLNLISLITLGVRFYFKNEEKNFKIRLKTKF